MKAKDTLVQYSKNEQFKRKYNTSESGFSEKGLVATCCIILAKWKIRIGLTYIGNIKLFLLNNW